MRKIYRNFITNQEANDLLKSTKPINNSIVDTKSEIIHKIVKKLKEEFDFNIKKQSYYLVEHMPTGHNWHVDVGNGNHMSWCDMGVSILLQEPLSGGDTYYADNIKGTNKIKSDRKIYDLVAHTSNEYHMVDAHEGERKVLLMFI